ncbi:hypothetical protein M405DRAFT_827342, partial [Rhizopogon salebrosus TDB-379]
MNAHRQLVYTLGGPSKFELARVPNAESRNTFTVKKYSPLHPIHGWKLTSDDDGAQIVIDTAGEWKFSEK